MIVTSNLTHSNIFLVQFVISVSRSQTGIANGTLALLVVTGSLFGFFSFHILFNNNVLKMYEMYIVVSLLTAVLTCIFVFEREKVLRQGDEGIHRRTSTQHSTKRNENINFNIPQDDESIIINEYEESVNENEKNNNDDYTNEYYYYYFPPIHILTYLLFYEPIMNKTRSEMISSYWIDTTEHRDFFIVTISRFFYYMGISGQTFFLYFIHDMLRQSVRTEDPEGAVALLAIVAQSAGAITCYPVGILSDQYFHGRRKPFVYTAW